LARLGIELARLGIKWETVRIKTARHGKGEEIGGNELEFKSMKKSLLKLLTF